MVVVTLHFYSFLKRETADDKISSQSIINTVKIGRRIALENFTTRKSDWTKLQCQQQESWDIRSLKLRK